MRCLLETIASETKKKKEAEKAEKAEKSAERLKERADARAARIPTKKPSNKRKIPSPNDWDSDDETDPRNQANFDTYDGNKRKKSATQDLYRLVFFN